MRNLISTLMLLALAPATLAAQHEQHEQATSPVQLGGGMHAVGLLTHVPRMFREGSYTEAYLTQPTLMGSAAVLGGALSAHASISLEGLTLERGELGPGSYGEGYVDRRHPHTYLHELVLTVMRDVGPVTTSATIGRGFAPFGTDDPMMRPFVKFPINHHLGQVLERLVVIGAARYGAVTLEGSVFAGNEPLNAKDTGRLDRFADSWGARVTVMAPGAWELQASHAFVASPELPSGGGWDQSKWSVSARHEHAHEFGRVYLLGEWKRTTESEDGQDIFTFGSMLGEATVTHRGWTPGIRVEYTDRPEEERSELFRSPWPHADPHQLGVTKWTSIAARLEKELSVQRLRTAPFVEASWAQIAGKESDLFEPDSFYGHSAFWTVSAGVRLGIGTHHARMGRYGAAVPAGAHGH